MTRLIIALCVCVAVAGCDQTASDGDAPADTIMADTVAVEPITDAADDQMEWPETGPVAVRRTRSVDLTGDGRDELVVASARGPAYDSLDIALTITDARGDTLWHESWPSLLYYKYESIQEKADSTVRRTVSDHVDQLVAQDRFTMDGGLPEVLRRGGEPEPVMREALRYHLAERDYRLGADLTPADATPPSAYDRISADNVPVERVDAVLAEVLAAPSFMYYAGGEATYVIAWSERENGFVRIFSCC